MRTSKIVRKTKETDIEININLDGKGTFITDTKIGFFDHMLTLFALHGMFDLGVNCEGDVEVDFHHSVEDVGIAMGEALREALGDKKGILRYGDKTIPMDETLVLASVDVSGRAYLNFDVKFPTEKIGEFDTELVKEFFAAFVRSSGITLHVVKLAGENSHHIAEAVFKSVARALREAVKVDDLNADVLPSTKGVL